MVNHSKQCETLFNRVDHFPGSTLVTLANFLSVASHICHLANTAFFIVLHCCALLDKKKHQVSQDKKLELRLEQLMYTYIMCNLMHFKSLSRN